MMQKELVYYHSILSNVIDFTKNKYFPQSLREETDPQTRWFHIKIGFLIEWCCNEQFIEVGT